MPLLLDGTNLTIENLVRVARFNEPVDLAPEARERIRRCRAFVEDKISTRAVMYGINTGIGAQTIVGRICWSRQRTSMSHARRAVSSRSI